MANPTKKIAAELAKVKDITDHLKEHSNPTAEVAVLVAIVRSLEAVCAPEEPSQNPA